MWTVISAPTGDQGQLLPIVLDLYYSNLNFDEANKIFDNFLADVSQDIEYIYK